jgi:hypothetical protein
MTTHYARDLTGADLDLAVALALREHPKLLLGGFVSTTLGALLDVWAPHTTKPAPNGYIGFDGCGTEVQLLICEADSHTVLMTAKRYGMAPPDVWNPSRRAAQGQPILEAARIGTWPSAVESGWAARPDADKFPRLAPSYGATMLDAGLRCFVGQIFGETIDLPTKE